MPGNDIFSDPDFLALDDAGKTRVLNQIQARTGVMPTPSTLAEENPRLGQLPSTNVPVGQTARDAAKIALISTAGEALGPLVNRVRGGIAGLRPGTAPAGVRDPGIPGEPRQGDIDYARNAQLNRASLQRGGAASQGPAGDQRIELRNAQNKMTLKNAARADLLRRQQAFEAAQPKSPTSSSPIWTPESSAQQTGMWHAGQGTMPNPAVQTPFNQRLAQAVRAFVQGKYGTANPGDEWTRSLYESGGKPVDPRGRGY